MAVIRDSLILKFCCARSKSIVLKQFIFMSKDTYVPEYPFLLGKQFKFGNDTITSMY